MLIIFSRHPTCCWRERFQDCLLLFLWGFRGLWLDRQSKGFDGPQIHANVQNHAKPVSFFYSCIWFYFLLYMYFNSTWTFNFIWAAIYAMLLSDLNFRVLWYMTMIWYMTLWPLHLILQGRWGTDHSEW